MRGRGARRAALALGLVGAAAWAAASCTLEERTDVPAQGSATASPGEDAEGAGAHYREVIQSEGVARLPVFSTAIRNGDLLWMSGQIGTAPGVMPPVLIEGGVREETQQTFENIRTVLDAAGLGFENVIKCTVFLSDIRDYAAVNEVYLTYFEGMDPPARSAVAGSALALGARVEVECVAAYPPVS